MKKILLAIASGILFVLSFPPFGLGFLAWAALVPLMFALDGQGWKKGGLLGLIFGFVFNLGAVYWVVHSMFYYGGVPFLAGIGVMLALVVYLSAYSALFGFFFTVVGRSDGILKIIIVPAIWVALEYIRGHLFTGFPWVLAGYSQAKYIHLIQIADTTGVWGVSFVIIASNTAIYLAVRSLIKKEPFPARPVVVTAALVVSIVAYGFMRISMVDRAAGYWSGLKAAVAQGSIDQALKWEASMEKTMLETYKDLSIEASKDGARFIVWPETAIPFYYDPEKVGGGIVGDAARGAMSFILTGSPSYGYNGDANRYEYFNSAYLLSPEGATIGRYDKTHLVPFGEYVPLRKILPFEKLTVGIGDFSPGKGPVPIKFGNGGIGVLICYESIFPEIARGAVKNGATLLVNITNDAWFGRTSAPYQHFDMAVLRAVENRSYLIRSANTGISAFIDPAGRVIKQTRLFEKAVITEKIRFREGDPSFYTMYGDVFAIGCLVLSTLFIITNSDRRKR